MKILLVNSPILWKISLVREERREIIERNLVFHHATVANTKWNVKNTIVIGEI